MKARFLMLMPLALLAACERKGDGAAVEITSDNGSTRISAGPGNESRLKLDTPGVKMDVNVPFLGALTDKMEIDGVKLYPGSKVAGVNIDASDAKDKGRFALRFSAPAGQDKVAAWFTQQFAASRFKMQLQGGRFTGVNDDGDPVTLDMSAGPNGGTEGEFRIADKP